jgi:phosphoglycerol transferase
MTIDVTFQKKNDFVVSENTTLPQRLLSDWKWVLIGALFSFEFASVLMLGWPAGMIPDVRLPYVFARDGLAFQWFAQRAIEGWIFTNPRSGFPFGSNLYDYPSSDSGILVILKILGSLTHSGFASVDLYLLLSFPAAFVVAFIVFRAFEIRKCYSAMAAVLFAFAPFHFSRLFIGHEFYTWYFGIPLFFYYGKNLFFLGQAHADLNRPTRYISFICVIAILSSFGVYYAFFGVIVLVIFGVMAAHGNRSVRPLINAVLFCCAIGAGVLINLLPNIGDRVVHGKNPEVATRYAFESEMYALKTMHLLLPQPDHRIAAFASFSNTYDRTFPLSNTTSSLGIIGTIGFLAIILAAGAALTGRTVSPKLGLASAIVLSLLLISTVGGFNVLFAIFVTPLIRGWDRISIFIEFGAILAFALLIDGSSRINGAPGKFGPRPVIAAACIALIGLWDQTPTTYRPKVEVAFQAASIDKKFIERIEAMLPPGSAVYQLPYIAFPESAPVEQLGVYQLGTAFFNSKELRWNFGGMAGREGDLFYRALSKESPEKQLEVIEKLGFSGIYIDRRGFSDRGESIIAKFTGLLGSGPALERSDGIAVLFKVPNHAAVPAEGMTAQQLMSKAGYSVDRFGVRSDATMADGIDFSASARIPSFVSDLQGLSVAEPQGRWSDANVAPSVVVSFTKPLPDRFIIELSGIPFGPNTGKKLKLIVGSVEKEIDMPGPFDVHVPIELKGEKVSSIELVPPKPASPEALGIGADPRLLGVALNTLRIKSQE